MRKLNPALDEYTPLFAANQGFLDKNPAKAKAFLRALSKGYQYAVDHPDEAADILVKAAPELNPALVKASQRFLSAQYRAEAPRWGEIDAGRWNAFFGFLTKTGVAKALPGSEKFFTNDFLPPAAKK
jgi:ABC-type nitrate/sulfonate/bicarbonate transport system substrate-binding protein